MDLADGVLAIMGSGETSPTMVTVHRTMVTRLGGTGSPGPSGAVLLDTPYGFQENAADISGRAQAYFRTSVGLAVTVAPGLRTPVDPGQEQGLALLRAARWVFSGPGSPSYALACWRDTPVADALRDRLRQGRGVTVLASAAAAVLGRFAVPVYEIYKVGQAPGWLDGLDLLGTLDLDVAVIPHYDNAEGGNHDTRYCYLGERRLVEMERKLPATTAVLGVDEHTAAVVDLATGTVEVAGRGAVTVRRAGRSTVLPAGTTLSLDELRRMAREGSPERSGRRWQGPGAPGGAAPGGASGQDHARTPAEGSDDGAGGAVATLTETAVACERRFDAASAAGDGDAMVAAILDLETAIRAWAGDTEEDDGVDRARVVLRTLVVRLGRAASAGLGDPTEPLRPVLDRLVTLRGRLRDARAYEVADGIRDALLAGGIEVRDDAGGSSWTAGSPGVSRE